MYYNVIIETSEKDKKGDYLKYYEFDNDSLEDVKKFIVCPFVKKENIFIDGRNIDSNNIEMIKIKEANYTTHELVNKAREKTPEVLGYLHNRISVLNDNFTKDITRSLLSTAIEENNGQFKKVSNSTISSPTLSKDKVFIVHGRDDYAKIEVARFIESLNLKAIILHEQNNGGKTIMEKIEEHTNVGYGIVLYTPCDQGSLKDDDKLLPRARQNVVFEHGYLIGKLGRNKVSALVKSEVETPGDINGLVYIQLDQAGGWKLSIAKELKNAGFSINFDKLL